MHVKMHYFGGNKYFNSKFIGVMTLKSLLMEFYCALWNEQTD